MIIGAHVSVSGGIENAIPNAEKIGCESFQIFTKNQNQWKEKIHSEEEILRFRTALDHSYLDIKNAASHDSYLINLCAVEDEKRVKSRQAFLAEIHRCEHMGIPSLIFHPGSHMGKGEAWGIQMIAESLQWALDQSQNSRVRLLLENTAGQGTNLGYSMAHLQQIIALSGKPQRMGVCLDTCHLFAAGYDLRGIAGYHAVMQEVLDNLDIRYIHAFHLNDSKRPLNSRVDRHEIIGEGHIGEASFRAMMNDVRFAQIPGFLETPGGDEVFTNSLKHLKSYRERERG